MLVLVLVLVEDIYIYIKILYVPSSNHNSPLQCCAITTTITASSGARRTQPVNCHHYHVIVVIVVPILPLYRAAGSMVTPFTVGAASLKVTCYLVTL